MGFVASLGLAAIFTVAVRQAFGTQFQAVPMAFPQSVEIFGAVIILQRLFIVFAALVLLVLLGILLHRTKAGLAILATAEDADAAALQGMSPNSTARLTMLLSAGLAGIAGALLAPVTIINPAMGQSFILIAFVIVIVGGAGSIRGALVASVIFGFLQSTVTTVVSPTAATAVGLIAMLAVLTFRPAGIFAHE
jgi:branched-chain amino acid transport system permease protein